VFGDMSWNNDTKITTYGAFHDSQAIDDIIGNGYGLETSHGTASSVMI
jgi:hypothetical protein